MNHQNHDTNHNRPTDQQGLSAGSDAPITNHLMIMAYGGPDKLEDVRPYLLDVRNYRETSEHVFEEITDRYRHRGILRELDGNRNMDLVQKELVDMIDALQVTHP